jgi:hypothetical protein
LIFHTISPASTARRSRSRVYQCDAAIHRRRAARQCSQLRNIENEKRTIEIRIRAERRCGELLAEMDKAKGGSRKPSHDESGFQAPKTLSQLGISDTQS